MATANQSLTDQPARPQAGPWGLRISGVGTALPEKTLTNEDLTAWMDTSDSWIRERTGIGERRIGGTTTGLATLAAERALAAAGIDAGDIDHLILATTTPDQTNPATATAVARELGIMAGAFDLQAVCSGWVYGLVMANGLLLQGMDRVLVIGAETLDRITDYHDRSTGILFGNGAGAAVVERDTSGQGRLLSWDLGSNGHYGHILRTEHGSTWEMDGREVFRQAVSVMERSATAAMAKAGLTADDIDVIFPHQANVRIVETAWKRLGFSMDQTVMVLDRTGNTSAASIPLALGAGLADGRPVAGDTVMFLGFGGGMTWGCAILDWAD